TRTRTPTMTLTPTRTGTPTLTRLSTLTPTATPCAGKPSAPTLLKPANGQQTAKQRVLLDWSDVLCTTKYKVIVREGNPKGTKVDGKRVTVSRYKTIALDAGNAYYWRVKACSPVGCTKSVA